MAPSLQEKLAQFDADLPLAKARTIPASWYFDPEIYQAECRAVFGQSWQVAGRADQVREPGSFVTTEIAGEPVLVVRDADGILRAFSNVCRHRAARVAHEPEGKVSRLRCRYHGWTYDLTGRLRGTPEFDGVEEFCKEEQGLPRLEAATWGPIAWAQLQATPAARSSLESFLAPLPEKTAGMQLQCLRFFERREYVLACNWKVFVDNYLDGGYHVNTIHPGLAGVLDYSQYRTEVSGNTSVQSSPVASNSEGETGNVRSGGWAYYWWIFPNFMLNLYDGIMDTNLVLPLGADRCKVIFDFYFANTEGADAQRFAHDSIAVAHQIQEEDLGICEDVQRGLASRSFDTGRFSVRREAAGYHFHRLLARSLQAHAT
jgi:choline monooxygenase